MKNLNRLLTLALALMMALSLTACGGSPKADSGAAPSAASTPNSHPAGGVPEVTQPTAPEDSEAEPHSFTLSQISAFSGGLASIVFEDQASGHSYVGTIDTDGKLQTYMSYTTDYIYKNGYTYFNGEENFYVINPAGEVVSYEKSNGDDTIQAGSNGYVITLEVKSGFDAVEQIYHIYDPSGAELTSFTSSQTYRKILCPSEGVFIFQENLDRGSMYYADLYFAKSNTWLNDQTVTYTLSNIKEVFDLPASLYSLQFENGLFVFYCGTDGEIRYIDSTETVHTTHIPAEYAGYTIYLGNANGTLYFMGDDEESAYNGEAMLYSLDIQTGQTTCYQGQYADRLTFFAELTPIFGEGYTAASLTGADGNAYTLLLNERLEEVCEPIPGAPFLIENGILYTLTWNSELYSYDLQGNLLAELGNVSADPFDNAHNTISEDLICSKSCYLRPDGSVAIDGSDIDYSTGTLLELS